MKLIIEKINKTKIKKNSLIYLDNYLNYKKLKQDKDSIIIDINKREIKDKLPNFILDFYSDIIIYEHLNKYYKSLSFSNKVQIIGSVQESINEEFKKEMELMIKNRLNDILINTDVLYLDGFILFRLKDYLKELDNNIREKANIKLLLRQTQKKRQIF